VSWRRAHPLVILAVFVLGAGACKEEIVGDVTLRLAIESAAARPDFAWVTWTDGTGIDLPEVRVPPKGSFVMTGNELGTVVVELDWSRTAARAARARGLRRVNSVDALVSLGSAMIPWSEGRRQDVTLVLVPVAGDGGVGDGGAQPDSGGDASDTASLDTGPDSQPEPMGLVARWLLDEAAETRVSDSAGINHGSLIPDATWAAGKLGGGGVGFNGTKGAVSVPDAPQLRRGNGESLTIATWMKSNRISGFQTIVSKGRNSSTKLNYALRIGQSALLPNRLVFSYRNQADTAFHSFATTVNQFSAGIWYHVAATYTFGNAPSMHLYVNGSEIAGTWVEGTGMEPPAASAEPLTLGGITLGAADVLLGTLDEVRIFNRALTPAEIFLLANPI
jgi:hypothetical protein